MNIEQLTTKLEELELPTPLTAYGASKVASGFTGKNIRPQMMVNYLGKKYLKGTKVPTSRGPVWNIDHESFRTWLERYCFRNLLTVR